ncbi:hypothetical protein BJ170DRAFT_380871 [Xylariales sp. AK1849]|nr:hypothetical protein BJ170DRAFT_380871 [Xylariales sp. AK1849]
MEISLNGILALTWAVVACLASPMPLEVSALSSQDTDLLVRKGIELAQSRELEKRLSADFSMEKTWDNEVLFGGSWNDTQEDAAEKTSLSITCLECYTKGTVTAKLWEDLLHPTVRLEFNQVEAYAFLGVETSSSGTFSINLFASQSPIGLGFPGLSVGVVFYVDLVFSLTEEIDLTGGFYVKLADDAYLEADIFGGDITDSSFDGISTKSIPVTVKSGSATFKADLRLRVQCGAETSLDLIGIGSGAVIGIYANIIEFVAVIDSTPDCALETKEWWDLNAGAYAHLDVVVDWTTMGPVPTVSTTLLTAPTMTQCWIEAGVSSASSASVTLSATTAPSTYDVTVSTSSSSSYGASATASLSGTGSTASSATSSSAQYPTVTSAPSLNSSTTLSGPSISKYPLTNSSSPSASYSDLVTSTVYSTATYTLTSCAVSVVNCPASYQKEVIVTQTIDAFTTICPASATITPPAKPAVSTSATAVPTAVHIITEQVVVLTPCATPMVETFVPPTLTSAVPEVLAVAVPGVVHATVSGHFAAETSSRWSNGTAVAISPASTGYARSSKSYASYASAPTQPVVTAAAAESCGRVGGVVAVGLFALLALVQY